MAKSNKRKKSNPKRKPAAPPTRDIRQYITNADSALVVLKIAQMGLSWLLDPTT